jgi:hypothetical protein
VENYFAGLKKENIMGHGCLCKEVRDEEISEAYEMVTALLREYNYLNNTKCVFGTFSMELPENLFPGGEYLWLTFHDHTKGTEFHEKIKKAKSEHQETK